MSSAPIIGALRRYAVRVRAQFTLTSNLRIADPSTIIPFVGPELNIAVGGWAIDLCLTGRSIGAKEVLALRLIDQIVNASGDMAAGIAHRTSELDPGVVARPKDPGNASLTSPLEIDRRGNHETWDDSTRPRDSRGTA